MIKKQKITARDVAKRAGVSPSTVSLILNGRGAGKFPEATCRRVINACDELGYIRRNRVGAVGAEEKVLIAIAPTLSNLYYVQMVEAMQCRAKELDYSLLVFNTFREIQQENEIMQICNRIPFAGLLLLYPPENSVLLTQASWTKPVIHIYDKNVSSGIDILEFDNFRIGSIVGEHLLELGHEKIAFVSASLESNQAARIHRLEGLQSVYQSHGFNPSDSIIPYTPEFVPLGIKSPSEGYELGYLMAQKVLQSNDGITAFATVNDMIAIGVMDFLINEGKKIPNDYSVCGCDNISIAKLKSISLTSVECFSTHSGREAVDMLVRKIEGSKAISLLENSPGEITRIEYFPKLVVRQSTGPKKAR